MNWKLIFLLSLAGVVIAVAGVLGLSSDAVPLIWLAVFIGYAMVIAKFSGGKYFLHAFVVSVINGVWIAVIHVAFFATYIAKNPEMIQSYEQLPHPFPVQGMMLIMGPLIGAATGVVAGVFAMVAGRLMNRKRKT